MINPKPLKNDQNVLNRKVGISAFLSFFIKIKNGSKEPKNFSFVRKFGSALSHSIAGVPLLQVKEDKIEKKTCPH